jgi:pyridoxine kinase
MARVLALSSHVAFGSVGLAVIVPALHALGHETIAVPTVVLSNHPGYGRRFAGERMASAIIEEMIDALDANGWLSGVDAVLTGYLPTAGHVASAAGAVARVLAANPAALVLCDPVCGDDPGGLYLDQSVPTAIAELLLPACTIATPNRFETSWLSGMPITTPKEAVEAARALSVPAVLVTSVPASGGRLATVVVEESAARACFVPQRETAPRGTGDLLAALYLGHVLNGAGPAQSLGRAVAGVEAAIAASGPHELVLRRAKWAAAEPLPSEPA